MGKDFFFFCKVHILIKVFGDTEVDGGHTIGNMTMLDKSNGSQFARF